MKVEKEPVMKYDVFQFVLTEEMIDEVNSSENRPDFYKKYIDTTWNPTAETIVAAKSFYKKVATIEAADLEQVFEIGNIGPEKKITRHAPMHSVSVGDVIVDATGVAKFVNRLGFTAVAF